MTRKEVLDSALKCVNGDRDEQYGSPEDSFKMIADFWNAYLKKNDIKPHDVAAMLALLKIARISGGQNKDDNWIDLAGYAACGGEVQNNHNYVSEDRFRDLYKQHGGSIDINDFNYNRFMNTTNE